MARPYAFTQITTFHVKPGATIENGDSEDGKNWAKIVRTYLEQPGVSILWWGRLLQQEEVVKLVVDWQSEDAHKLFTKSSAFTDLANNVWPQLTTTTTTTNNNNSQPSLSTRYFELNSFQPKRENAFSRRHDGQFISTILTFSLNSSFSATVQSSDPQKRDYEHAWNLFSSAVLHTEGGVVSSSTAEGWSLPVVATATAAASNGLITSENKDKNVAFCGIVRYADIASMRRYLREAEGRPGLEGGLETLMAPAERLTVEFAKLRCFKDGWLGDVNVSEPERPQGSSLFGSTEGGSISSLFFRP